MRAVLQNLSKWHLKLCVCLHVFVPVYGSCLYYMSPGNTAQSVYTTGNLFICHIRNKCWQCIVMWRQGHVTLLPSESWKTYEPAKSKHQNSEWGKIYCCLLKSYWLCVSNVTFSNNWFMREITSGDWNSPRRQMLFLILKTKQFLIIFSPTVLNTLNEEKLAETFPSPCDICLLWVGQLWRFVMYKDVYKPTEFHIRGTINMSNCNFKNALKVRHFMRYMLAFIW